jgi:ABC-type dipeptide/oligopeptide/nickel transport system ATPase subunit
LKSFGAQRFERKWDDGPRITPEQAEAARARAVKKQNQGDPNGAAPEQKEQADNDSNWFDSVELLSIDELLSFNRDKDPDSLLGNRWLCRGYQVVIHGETGIGKSSLILQAAICWCLDQAFFGIVPKRSLKVLFIEAENDKGDLGEVLQDVIKAMKLTPDQIRWVKQHLTIIREYRRTGKDFINLARRLIAKFQPDVVFADPLLSYAGEDLSQQKAMSQFLRANFTPLLNETGVIWFWVHHVSKPPRDDKAAVRRGAYAMFGSVELAGVARETISINKVDWDTRLFELEFGKRSRRLGVCDELGNPIYKLYIRQSAQANFWEAVDQTEAAKQSGKANQSARATKMVRAFIEKKINVTHAQLRQYAKQIPVGQNAAIEIAQAVVDDKSEPRIYEYKIKLSRTNASNAFSTVKEEDNPFTFNRKKGRK